MTFKKLAALLLALALCLMTGCSGKDLEAQIADLESQLAEKTTYIAELETAAGETAAAIAELENKLAEETAAAENEAAAASDAEAAIADKDTAIADLEAQIAEKDAAIADLEAQIAEKDTAIADMEAQIAGLNHQIEAANYVAEFDGGYVTVDEAMAEYSYVEYMYSMYGYSMDGYEDYIKSDIATTMVEDKIVQMKAAELGLNVPTAEEETELRASAEATLQEYVLQYRADFVAEGLSDEEVDAQTLAFLMENGVDSETLYQQELIYFAADKLYENVVADVAVTEEEVKAEYDAKVAADEANYANNLYYEQAMMSGTQVYWTPEGYRNVRQVLIKFDDEQTARYDEITDRIADLEAELAELQTAEEPAEETEAAETEAPAEETVQRTEAEIQADIDAANAELDALFAELEPMAAEVAQKFAEGTPIDELIATYGGDPGSINADGTTNTYQVSANSASYDQAFTDAAMSVAEIGGLSEPGRGMYGLYIVYYDSDVVPGAVDYETVKEDIYYELLDLARSEAYDAQISQWVAELNVVYYMENFR